jgi:acyl carrier protein
MSDAKAEIRRFIEDNFIMGASAVTLQDSDSFLDHHVLDSTGFLELIGFLEETYAIVISDAEMIPENLDSVDSIAQFLARKREA